jgi:hypothetical protein
MVGSGRRLDPVSEADLRKALSLARATTRTYASLATTLVLRIQPLGLPFSDNDLKLIADAKRLSLMSTLPGAGVPDALSPLCGPLGAVPPRYGQSQFALVPALSDQVVKTLPDFGAR